MAQLQFETLLLADSPYMRFTVLRSIKILHKLNELLPYFKRFKEFVIDELGQGNECWMSCLAHIGLNPAFKSPSMHITPQVVVRVRMGTGWEVVKGDIYLVEA